MDLRVTKVSNLSGHLHVASANSVVCKCAVWPPFKSPSRLIKAVSSREPPVDSWKSYPIRVLYKHGKQLYISFSYERSKHIFYRKAVHWVSAEFDKCPVCLHSWEITGNLVGTWSDLIISHVRVDQMSCTCSTLKLRPKKKNCVSPLSR